MINKESLKKKFQKNWRKHYNTKVLRKNGFIRKKCEKCKDYFWTTDKKQKICFDSKCYGFKFLGKKRKNWSYVKTWKEVEKFFVKNKHTSISRYPVIARWRDDLFFTIASISDFQPYVVSGEIDPPANPLIIPQECMRFNDLENVGRTGGHYTSFIMIGQHAFNTRKKEVYWKEKAIELDLRLLTKVLGLKKKEINFKEDVWVGGNNFGPNLEFFSHGLELGNCVFMQYEFLDNKGERFRELDTRVIDMGAGLERFAWVVSGKATSYEIVFRNVLNYMRKQEDLKINYKKYLKYMEKANELNIDEFRDVEKRKERILRELGLGEEFRKKLEKLEASYIIADHLKSFLFAVTDGLLPGNIGGSYNIRLVLRRAFNLRDSLNLKYNFSRILEEHIKELKPIFPELVEVEKTAKEVLRIEEEKYRKTRENVKKKVKLMISKVKAGGKITERDFARMYESEGIQMEDIVKAVRKEGLDIKIPENVLSLILSKREKKEKIGKEIKLKGRYPKTKVLFYEREKSRDFKARILGAEGKYLVLDKSLFYAEAGGQESDYGKIVKGKKEFIVQKVINNNGIFLHKLKDVKGLKKGDMIKGEINWERRLQLTKHHTATHIVGIAARKVLGRHIWQAGAHKAFDKSHLDVTHFKSISNKELREIELTANKIVERNLRIKKEFYTRNKAEEKFGFNIYQGGYVPGKTIRVVRILDEKGKNLDVQACGGTHLDRTGEVNFIKIVKRESIQDGVERLVFKAGLEAVKHVEREEEKIKNLGKIVGAPVKDLEKNIERIFSEWKTSRKEIDRLKDLILEDIKKRIASGETRITEKSLTKQDTLRMFSFLHNKKLILETRDGILAFNLSKTELDDFERRGYKILDRKKFVEIVKK